MPIPTTRIYRCEPGAERKLLQSVSHGFVAFRQPQPQATATPKQQLDAALAIAGQWRRLRHFPPGTVYEIEQAGEVVATGGL